jgi:hypothetical protein
MPGNIMIARATGMCHGVCHCGMSLKTLGEPRPPARGSPLSQAARPDSDRLPGGGLVRVAASQAARQQPWVVCLGGLA